MGMDEGGIYFLQAQQSPLHYLREFYLSREVYTIIPSLLIQVQWLNRPSVLP